jgi:aminoglycoside 3-N-acetyltransferase
MDVSRSDIVSAIRTLGVGVGDELLVHSSLSSFGRVHGGAATVVQALLDTVAPGGTVCVPTFNYGQLPYDRTTTPSLTGAITESFRRLSGAVRSGHPTHPLAALGPQAQSLLEGHERTTPFGPGSPLWRLWERDAWVLLIGCDHRANSMIHVAEEFARVPYLDRTRVTKVLQPDGRCVDIIVRRPGDSMGFNKVDAPLRARGAIRDAVVGNANLMLMRAGDVVTTASEMLKRDPDALLCDDPGCERCAQARVMIDRS